MRKKTTAIERANDRIFELKTERNELVAKIASLNFELGTQKAIIEERDKSIAHLSEALVLSNRKVG